MAKRLLLTCYLKLSMNITTKNMKIKRKNPNKKSCKETRKADRTTVNTKVLKKNYI